jgi:hypothetical protein
MLGERTEMEEVKRVHGTQDTHWAGHGRSYPRGQVGEVPDIGLEVLEVLLLDQHPEL